MTNEELFYYHILPLAAKLGVPPVAFGKNGKLLCKIRFGTNKKFLELSKGSMYVKGINLKGAKRLSPTERACGAKRVPYYNKKLAFEALYTLAAELGSK